MYYASRILKDAGFTEDIDAIAFSNIIALTNAIFTVVAMFLIERLGRRNLLFLSLIGSSLGLIMLGGSYFVTDSTQVLGYLALNSLAIYVGFFAIGLGPIPWVVNSEIYSHSIRGVANGLATTVNWASNFVVSISFLSYQDAVGPSIAFWTYAIICIIAVVVFYSKLPETKGKTLEEIQQEFEKQ